ncbi:MAG TPA: trypsin-like peptidase domain-containing protein [Chthonomonadaceae bacterium]|nr:trypsin-like peptidase domain-containing protein [Chthonomonadaceae bacterium]
MNSHSSYSQAPNRSRLRMFLVVVAAFVVGGLILPNIRISWKEPVSQAETDTGLGIKPGAPEPLSADEIYARAAQAAYKSVVFIDTTERVQIHDMMDQFFPEPRYSQQQMQGSGVIVSPDGYILTNEHVVGGSNVAGRTISITLTDGHKYTGTVVGADRLTDVALIKVDAGGLPAARMGTVKGLVPGQLVVAIGNPFELRFTVTHGVVSALQRPVTTPDGRTYADLIQHDALINPGNSGGPLVDRNGQVIGINTLVESNAQGIGFAIPIDTALRVADELKRFGRIKRPWLGIIPITNTTAFADYYGLPSVQGVVVGRLADDGPAAGAGLQVGDVITQLNGQPVKSREDFENVEKSLHIGQHVKVIVMRSDGRGEGTVTVGEAP